jgi:hypothetical protein
MRDGRARRAQAVKDCRDFPNRGHISEFGGATDPHQMILDRPRGSEPVITCNLE